MHHAECILGYFMIPQNEIRRFGIRQKGTEPSKKVTISVS